MEQRTHTRRRPFTYGNVVSTICLVLLLTGGGVAYAHHGLITANEIKKEAVRSKHIKDGRVKSRDIRNDNVKSKDIRDGTLRARDLRSGAVTMSKVADNARVKAWGAYRSADIDDFTDSSYTSMLALPVDVPAGGVLHVTATLNTGDDASLAGDGRLSYRLKIDTTAAETATGDSVLEGGSFGRTGTATIVAEVSAGTNVVHLEAKEVGTGTYIYDRSLSILYTPYGSGVSLSSARAVPRVPAQP